MVRPEDLYLQNFLGGNFNLTSQEDLDRMRQTVADLLTKSFYGPTLPVGAGLPPMEPLFGVQLQDPTQMAADFYSKPYNVQQAMLSAWGVRNMNAPSAFERMRAVTPQAMPNYGPIQYGYAGLAVRPA